MFRLRPHPGLHGVFEALAYALGFQFYRLLRRRYADVLGSGAHTDAQRLSVIAAAAVGPLVGSRVLGLLEQVPRLGFNWHALVMPTGGKTIVGGLLGGWLGVELIKRVPGIRTRTGDLFVLPLCAGIHIAHPDDALEGTLSHYERRRWLR